MLLLNVMATAINRPLDDEDLCRLLCSVRSRTSTAGIQMDVTMSRTLVLYERIISSHQSVVRPYSAMVRSATKVLCSQLYEISPSHHDHTLHRDRH